MCVTWFTLKRVAKYCLSLSCVSLQQNTNNTGLHALPPVNALMVRRCFNKYSLKQTRKQELNALFQYLTKGVKAKYFIIHVVTQSH